jgi:hypothetical protein
MLLPAGVTLSRSEGSAAAGSRDASLRLSMTGWSRLLLPAGVTLSRSEGSVWMGVEMLRSAQHDSAILLLRHRHLRAFRLSSPQRMVIGNFLG